MCYYDIPEDLWLRLEPILPTEGSPRGGGDWLVTSTLRRNYMTIHRSHDISDNALTNIEKLLLGSKASVGRPSTDNRLLINTVF